MSEKPVDTIMVIFPDGGHASMPAPRYDSSNGVLTIQGENFKTKGEFRIDAIMGWFVMPPTNGIEKEGE